MRRRDWWDFHNTVVETKRKAMVIALLEEKSEKIPAERSRTTVSLCTEFFFLYILVPFNPLFTSVIK